MNILEVNNICKSFFTKYNNKYIKQEVLNNCSFVVKSGSIFGLAGLNGIGKTTLIKIILDLMYADNGEVKIFGKNNKIPQSRENICYLPEKFSPSPYLTGYEFLELSLSFFKKKMVKEKVNKIAKQLDLDPDVLKYIIKKYSKGMAQKLGLIWCLMSDAKLLILDEPMSGLDPRARVLLKQSIKQYIENSENKNHRNSVFFSSHIIDDMEEICDEMVVLNNSKIKFIGTPKDMRIKYPESSSEKSFLKCIEEE